MHIATLRGRWLPLLAALIVVGLASLLGPHAGAAQDVTFTVTVEDKTEAHPNADQGFGEGFVIDGVQGKTLTLIRGVTYTFQMQDVPSIHPFYLSMSDVGAGAEPFSEGVTGNFATGDQFITFTPDASTPDLLYYQCGTHQFMGWQIHVQDQKEAATVALATGFTAPVALAESPDGSRRLFVVDQVGQIWIVMPDGTRREDPFLDISDRLAELNPNFDERGLLGLAFHPDYPDNGQFYVYYSAPLRDSAPDDWDNTSRVSEFTVSDTDPHRADPNSERILLEVDQPQFNHAAGTVAFGPDGFLYISLGDGGGANDTGTGHVADWYDANDGGNGQNVDDNLLGSILRIDVDNRDPGFEYAIPEDNPFVGTDGLDEQYAYGLRNPFRFSFDQGGDNMLVVGDAGQDLWEEVSVVTRGGNYGWNVMEGRHCFDADNSGIPLADCPDEGPEGDPLIDPVIEFLNANEEGGLGLVVVGGYVYRGTALSELEGDYIFGVWSEGAEGGMNQPGRIFAAEPQDEGPWPFQELHLPDEEGGDPDLFILSFGQDLEGEVYALMTDEVGPTGNTGVVVRLDEAGTDTANEPDAEVPSTVLLEQNFPNPFNPVTTIRYQVPEAGQVSLRVFDVLGREVATLVNERVAPGVHTVEWDGTNEAGRAVSSGIYLYRIRTDDALETRTMTLLK